MKSANIRQNLHYVVAILITVFAITVMNGPFFRAEPEDELVMLESGWTIRHGEDVQEGVRLDAAMIGDSQAGDVFEAIHPLPSVEVKNACVRVSTVLSALDVYVDDTLLYSFGHDRGAAGRMIPTRMHFIALPENYTNKEMRLVVTVYYDGTFSGFSQVAVGNRNDIQEQMLQNYRMPLFSGIFLIIFAFVLIVMSVYMVVYETSSARIYASAALLLILGFYILSFYDLIDILTNRPELRTILEYVSFFLIPAGGAAYVATISSGRAKKIITVVAAVCLMAALAAFAMHALNICFLNEMLPVFQGMIVLGSIPLLIYLFYTLIYDKKTVRRKSDSHIRASEAVLLGGVAYLFVSALFDMLRYAYLKFFSHTGTAYSDIQTITHGALVFAACLMVNYFYYSIDFLNAQVVRERMRGLAYTDTLTGLANRTRCEEVMQRLHGRQTSFIIVSLDVNDLKVTNDRFGHAQGDALLKGFAEILAECFGEEAYLIGRMGGDEFIAIFKEKPYSRVQVLLEELSSGMKKKNRVGQQFTYDAAWGVAASEDAPDASAHDIYMMADTRMYANKTARKRARDLSGRMNPGGQEHA